MSNAIESDSFGRYLKAERCQKGIDLRHISKETRIRHETLQLIEMEDHDKLPAEVFTKGFLRAYAASIGVDGDEVIRRYTVSRDAHTEAGQIDSDPDHSESTFWRHLQISLGILFVILVVFIPLVYWLQDPPPAPVAEAEPEMTIAIGDKEAVLSVPPLPKIEEEAPPVSPLRKTEARVIAGAPEKLLLIVETIERTWMRVIIDGRSPKEYSLRPPDRLALEATTGFDLFIGNSAGLRLSLNGESVTVSGERGKVIRLKLP